MKKGKNNKNKQTNKQTKNLNFQELPLRENSILITLLLETKGFKGQQKIKKNLIYFKWS
jgi:hypothetical protein